MSEPLAAAPDLLSGHNLPEFSVSEISLAVKRTLEGALERGRGASRAAHLGHTSAFVIDTL